MKKILIILSTIWLFYNCSNNDSYETLGVEKDFISLPKDTLFVGPDGGNLDVLIESSGEWTLTGSKVDWITPSITKGQNGQTLTFDVKPNDVNQVLMNTYKVFTGAVVQKLTIVSNPSMNLALESDQIVSVDSEKKLVDIILATNETDLSYEFSNDGNQWIKVLSFESAFGKKILVLEVSKNDKYIPRSSVLTIKGSEKNVTVDITQAQVDALMLEDGEEVYKEIDLTERDLTFNIKTNVSVNDFEFEGLPEWITFTGTIPGETFDGLQKLALKFHVSEAIASRKADISLSNKNNSSQVLTLTVKQQNPNPTLVKIPDLNFRKALAEKEWVILTDKEQYCELLEKGITEKTLDLSGTSKKNYGITSLEGIESFKQIEVLNLRYNKMEVIDISKLKNVSELDISDVPTLKIINVGDNPVTSLESDVDFETTSLSISGSNITEIDLSSFSWGDYDKLTELDVTGCSSLKQCDVQRANLKKVYVTKKQKDEVKFDNQDEDCEIVIKDNLRY